jgi:hypothetical protein
MCAASCPVLYIGGHARNTTTTPHNQPCCVCCCHRQPLPNPRCINTWDCAYFTRTPKGRCWLKGQVGWTIRPQADPCPDTTCTEGQEVTPLPSDAEDEAGPVPAADGSGGASTPSPSPNTGRRLRGQLQPTPPTPPASPAASPALAGNEEEEDPGVDGNTTNPSNTTSTTSSPPPTAPAAAAASPFPDANGPPAAASPSPVPGEGQDDSEEESPAPSVAACARWVSGAVNNHYVPGHDFACTIGQP